MTQSSAIDNASNGCAAPFINTGSSTATEDVDREGHVEDNSLLHHESGGASSAAEVFRADLHARHRFLRRMYGTLGLQLVTVFAITTAVATSSDASQNLREHEGVLFAAVGMTLATFLVIFCVRSVLRGVAWNASFLLIITVLASWTFACIAASAPTVSPVLIALGIVGATVLILTLFCCQYRIPFTLLLSVVVSCISSAVILGCLLGYNDDLRSHAATTSYAAIAALLFLLFISLDTLLLLSGKHKHSPKSPHSLGDAFGAALSVCVDLVGLFAHLAETLFRRGE